MEKLHKSSVVQTTCEELARLKEQYGVNNEQEMHSNIMEIRNWMKTENHLVEASNYINDNVIKRMYIVAGGSIEETKIKIDKYCTARYLSSELCLNKNISEFDLLCSKVQYTLMPKLNSRDMSRLAVLRFLSSDLNDISLLSLFRYVSLVDDYAQSCDINLSYRAIVDYNNFPFSFYLKLNPFMLKNTEMLFMKTYGYEVKGLHLVNVPSFIDKLLVLTKFSFSKSLSSLITVHRSYEELEKYLPKDVIPKEYGGDGPSCFDVAENMKETLQSEDGRKIIANAEKLISDETRRTSRKFSEKLLGILGSFYPFGSNK